MNAKKKKYIYRYICIIKKNILIKNWREQWKCTFEKFKDTIAVIKTIWDLVVMVVTQNSNSNCDKTQKLKQSPNSKFLNVAKFKNSNCDKTKKENCDETQNSNCDRTQKLKLWQNLKTQIMTKLKNPNCEKQKKTN